MDFLNAQAAVLKDHRSRCPENGLHAMWLRSLISAIENMTETLMLKILSGPPSKGCSAEAAKYDAAGLIKALMDP